MDYKGSLICKETVQPFFNGVKYVATPTLALIKVTGERTNLQVETQKITWRQLWLTDVFLAPALGFVFWGGYESPTVSQLIRRAMLCETGLRRAVLKNQQPPSTLHYTTSTWPNTRWQLLSGPVWGTPTPIQLPFNQIHCILSTTQQKQKQSNLYSRLSINVFLPHLFSVYFDWLASIGKA